MGRSPFNARVWLNSAQAVDRNPQSFIPKFQHPVHQNTTQKFNPSDFFVKGWKGDGLASRSTFAIVRVLEAFEEDARKQFETYPHLNKTLKVKLFHEFLAYADAHAYNFSEIDNYQTFWEHLKSSHSKYRKSLDTFISIYCLRVAIIFLFKIRFLTQLCRTCQSPFTTKDLLNPGSFFAHVFKKGSSRELKVEALQSNHYSWYRPSNYLAESLKKLSEDLGKVSLNEMLKTFSQKIEKVHQGDISFSDSYSHSLSHVQVGRFLSTLLMKLPRWMDNGPLTSSMLNGKGDFPGVITCRFTGDHLPSLSLGHWLSQEKSVNIKWNQIICPEFEGNHFSNGPYVKICYELQFLTFLTTVGTQQGFHPIDFICNVMNKRNASFTRRGDQISLFEDEEQEGHKTYDRVVLNINNFPKNNPHFYLLHRLNDQLPYLSDHGLLIVMSSKKLFVPSQSEKIEQLLKNYKLEAQWSLEEVKGKGELAPYIYILRKRKQSLGLRSNDAFGTAIETPLEKESCSSFRLTGELESFHEFGHVVNEVNKFIKTKNAESTSFFQSEFESKFHLEYFQNAILNGKLINSTKSTSEITHPNFFKNLLKSSVPFDSFFAIDKFEPQSLEEKASSYQLLGHQPKENYYPLVLMVDMRNPEQVNIQIFPSQTYQAKSQEYGFALCSYFGLVPKRQGLNLNLFREYFSSFIGQQVLQMSLTGKTSKLKAKLSSVLVPRFFMNDQLPDEHELSKLGPLQMDQDQMLQVSPVSLERHFDNLGQTLSILGRHYPWYIMGQLVEFKTNLEKALNKIRTTKGENYFENPVMADALRKTKTHPIFPENEEIFVEIMTNSAQAIYSSLTGIKMNLSEKMGETQYNLDLLSGETVVLRMYSDIRILKLIRYILSNVTDMTMANIIQNLEIPRVEDLKNIFKDFEQLMETLSLVHKKTEQSITQMLTKQLTYSSERAPATPQSFSPHRFFEGL